MEEFDVIENYLRHGDYISDRNCESSNLRRNNCKFDEGILYYWKKTDTSLMLYDSSFNGRLSHVFQVQIAKIYRLAIKEKKIMVARDAASQAAACSTLTCGVIAIALTYHFLVVKALFLYICTAYVCNQNGLTRK